MRRMRRTRFLAPPDAETVLTADDLIQPVFVIEGKDRSEPVQACRASIAQHRLVAETGRDVAAPGRAGDRAVPGGGAARPERQQGKEAYNPRGLVQRAVRG